MYLVVSLSGVAPRCLSRLTTRVRVRLEELVLMKMRLELLLFLTVLTLFRFWVIDLGSSNLWIYFQLYRTVRRNVNSEWYEAVIGLNMLVVLYQFCCSQPAEAGPERHAVMLWRTPPSPACPACSALPWWWIVTCCAGDELMSVVYLVYVKSAMFYYMFYSFNRHHVV